MGTQYGINLDNIDWELLIEQKKILIKVINQRLVCKKEKDALDGILHLLDKIDDTIDAGDYIIQQL